jgi:TPR repeat protein
MEGWLLIAVLFFVVLMLYLFGMLKRLLRSNPSLPTLPEWDIIDSKKPIFSVPPVEPMKQYFVINLLARWLKSSARTGSQIASLGEMYEIGTKYTPKNAEKARQLYEDVVFRELDIKNSYSWARLRLAEMYEDGEGGPKNFSKAEVIYRTIPNYPSSMLFLAKSRIVGAETVVDLVDAYKLLLVADKFFSLHQPSAEEMTHEGQKRRENFRHIHVKNLMEMLERQMTPADTLTAHEAAREYWNKNRGNGI